MARHLPALPLLLAACAAPPPGATPASANCPGAMVLRNASPTAVEQFFANAGPDLLAPGTLPPGAQHPFQASPGQPNSFRVVFVDGTAGEITGINPCDTPVLTVIPRGLRASGG